MRHRVFNNHGPQSVSIVKSTTPEKATTVLVVVFEDSCLGADGCNPGIVSHQEAKLLRLD
jgi:hypothetical protein